MKNVLQTKSFVVFQKTSSITLGVICLRSKTLYMYMCIWLCMWRKCVSVCTHYLAWIPPNLSQLFPFFSLKKSQFAEEKRIRTLHKNLKIYFFELLDLKSLSEIHLLQDDIFNYHYWQLIENIFFQCGTKKQLNLLRNV